MFGLLKVALLTLALSPISNNSFPHETDSLKGDNESVSFHVDNKKESTVYNNLKQYYFYVESQKTYIMGGISFTFKGGIVNYNAYTYNSYDRITVTFRSDTNSITIIGFNGTTIAETYVLYNNGAWQPTSDYIAFVYESGDIDLTALKHWFDYQELFGFNFGDVNNFNGNGLFGSSAPFVVNSLDLDSTTNNQDGTPYYIFRGLAYDSEGNAIKGIHYTIENAVGKGYYDKEKSENILVDSTIFSRDDYISFATLVYDYFDGSSISVVSPVHAYGVSTWGNNTAIGPILTSKWEWNYFIQVPNYLKIAYVDTSYEYQVADLLQLSFNNSKSLFTSIFNRFDYSAYPYSVYGTGVVDYDNHLGDSFTLINSAFTGLIGLMSVQLLPMITVGTLMCIPLVLSIIFFIIKLFKR